MTDEGKARQKARGYDTEYAEDFTMSDMLSRPQDFDKRGIKDVYLCLKEKHYRDGYLDGLVEGRKESIIWHDINATLPEEDGEYLIKCYQPYNDNFDGPYTFTTAADFSTYDYTFDIDFCTDTEILKWAKMPE